MTTADLDGWEAIGRRQLAESYRSQFDEEAVDALQAGADTLTAMVEIARDGDADRTAAAVDRAAQQLGDVEEAVEAVTDHTD